MVNPGGVVFDLRKFPADQFDRFKTSVLNGKGQAMPPWREKLSDEEETNTLRHVADYDPEVFKGRLKELGKLLGK